MNAIRRSLLLCVTALAVQGLGAAVSTQTAPQSNWMSELVEGRVRQLTERSQAGDQPRLLLPQIQPRIVGGERAGARDNPFQVALLNKSIADVRRAQFCGGTLVRPDVVVTAAHCSDFVTAAQVQVLTHARTLDGSGIRHDVVSVVVHPQWNRSTNNNDVAVWKMAGRVTNLPLATLAIDDGPVGGDLLATGWGALAEQGPLPLPLMKVSVPLVDRSRCNAPGSYNGAISNAMLCAGPETGGRDACQGDSGGPLTRGPGNAVLTGITSWGRGCARPGLYGVYTRVSDPGIRGFIERNF